MNMGCWCLNDFWESTQDFQLGPQDPALFLDNAADIIRRYRNHPSIAVWFGRNEGVPQPILQRGPGGAGARSTAPVTTPAARTASICRIAGPITGGRRNSYFTELAKGSRSRSAHRPCQRSRRCGVDPGGRPLAARRHLCLSRLAFRRQRRRGDLHGRWRRNTAPATEPGRFRAQGAAHGLRILPGDLRGVRGPPVDQNSGRLLWMTHPAWPSNTWQIYSSDYDTPAAYYAVKKACEPLHVQLDLPDYRWRS